MDISEVFIQTKKEKEEKNGLDVTKLCGISFTLDIPPYLKEIRENRKRKEKRNTILSFSKKRKITISIIPTPPPPPPKIQTSLVEPYNPCFLDLLSSIFDNNKESVEKFASLVCKKEKIEDAAFAWSVKNVVDHLLPFRSLCTLEELPDFDAFVNDITVENFKLFEQVIKKGIDQTMLYEEINNIQNFLDITLPSLLPPPPPSHPLKKEQPSSSSSSKKQTLGLKKVEPCDDHLIKRQQQQQQQQQQQWGKDDVILINPRKRAKRV